MAAQVIYRELTPRDIPSIVSLVHSIYSIKRSPEFVRWQCFENIFPVRLVGGFSNEELVGMFGLQKRMLSGGVIVGQLSYLNISPKWRGYGHFKKLGNLAINHFEDIDLICVFANSNAWKPCVSSFGMKTVGTIKTMELSLDSFKDYLFPSSIIPVTKLTVLKQFKNDKTFFVKDDNFRHWRYVLHPSNDYFTVSLKTGEYIIFKIFVDPLTGKSFGDLVEVGCPSNETPKICELLLRVCSEIKKITESKVNLWALPGTTLREVATKIGFVETGHECFFVAKIFSDEFAYLYTLSSWDLAQSDATNY